MGWAIGAIEVLSLIVFVGFAVDYCLHLCEAQSKLSASSSTLDRGF